MTTDDLTRTITKFTVSNGRGPSSVSELQMVLVSSLGVRVDEFDVREQLEVAISGGLVHVNDQGCFAC